MAARLFSRDRYHSHRILLIEAGAIALPEHVQNLPALETTEPWRLPWNADPSLGFPGLFFCLGGRSVIWGGWSPHFIDTELASPPWPDSVVTDLTTEVLDIGDDKLSYLDHAANQIGASAANDFIHGPLHDAMRDTLFDELKKRASAGAASPTQLVGSRGTSMTARRAKLQDELEAPLAVESTSPRPGFLPFNKFSTVPLMVRVARIANQERLGDDVRKRLMVLADTRVASLGRQGRRITEIRTNRGALRVPEGGLVFLGLGTVENTRLALNTLDNAQGLIGANLMAHLRTNVTVRVPRSAFGDVLDRHPELQVSALFVKGVHDHSGGDGQPDLSHFHIQITASGVGRMERGSEVELFKKVPDIDLLDRFKTLTDEWVVITLRGIGEMQPNRAASATSRIDQDLHGPRGPEDDTPRALVRLAASPRDEQLWDAMDAACLEVAQIFARGGTIEYLSDNTPGAVWQDTPPDDPLQRRDKLGSTHHEGGTLWMGDDATTSLTDHLGRAHDTDNLYALGPCLLPTMGSPNPVLSGIALTRRTADRLSLAQPKPPDPDAGFHYLFDGTEASFKRWQAVGQGRFYLVDGMIVAQHGGDLGLLYYATEQFDDFILRLEFRLHTGNENSGVHLRFRDPYRRVPDPSDPATSHVYDNKAWVAVDTGFEVQIDETAAGDPAAGIPDGLDQHRTGAIYAVPVGTSAGQQDYTRQPVQANLAWNSYEIHVSGDDYTVRLNGNQTTSFTNDEPARGRARSDDPLSGFVGLQSHPRPGAAAFRHIHVKPLG
ncbi:MAG: DUF1080 domain-containing protein [Actinomycetota bacterium]|nr:DUF1080 domain-containing protein [Actinomycetota bacterium]